MNIINGLNKINMDLAFKDIKVFKNLIEIDNKTRLYFDIRTYDGTHEDKVGFDFIALSCVGYTLGGKNEYYFSPTSDVEVIVDGIAYFDGVRHLYYGSERSDNFGYHYYPDLEKIIKVLQELKKLEDKYCKDI